MAGCSVSRTKWVTLTCVLLAGCASPAPKTMLRANRPSHFVYGNYCGFGTRYGSLATAPINALDAACRVHDACYISGRDHCVCDAALVTSAGNIAKTTGIKANLRIAAIAATKMFSTPFCRMFPKGVLPERDKGILKTWLPSASGEAP